MPWPRGHARYVVATLAELRVFSPLRYRLQIDGEVARAGRDAGGDRQHPSYGGGMRICPDADPSDGLLDVTIIHPVSRLKLLQLLPQMYSGRFARDPCVEQLRATEVQRGGRRLVGFGDGELVGAAPLRVRVAPGRSRSSRRGSLDVGLVPPGNLGQSWPSPVPTPAHARRSASASRRSARPRRTRGFAASRTPRCWRPSPTATASPSTTTSGEACAHVEAGSGVLVAAPTGAGKTIVGEFAVFLALQTGRKCFYTTPIKALSNQKYADLVRRHGAGQRRVC